MPNLLFSNKHNTTSRYRYKFLNFDYSNNCNNECSNVFNHSLASYKLQRRCLFYFGNFSWSVFSFKRSTSL